MVRLIAVCIWFQICGAAKEQAHLPKYIDKILQLAKPFNNRLCTTVNNCPSTYHQSQA